MIRLTAEPIRIDDLLGATADASAGATVLFVGMIPMTRVNWAHMRLPEFKIFELAVARNAFVFAIIGFILGWIEDSRFIRSDVWGTVVVLMAFAYGNLKAQTIIFRDFYREAIDRKKEGKLLADLETPEMELPPLDSEDELTPDAGAGAGASAPDPGFPPPPSPPAPPGA